jgi:hypothetical protein
LSGGKFFGLVVSFLVVFFCFFFFFFFVPGVFVPGRILCEYVSGRI